jgi:hypothetical protein
LGGGADDSAGGWEARGVWPAVCVAFECLSESERRLALHLTHVAAPLSVEEVTALTGVVTALTGVVTALTGVVTALTGVVTDVTGVVTTVTGVVTAVTGLTGFVRERYC